MLSEVHLLEQMHRVQQPPKIRETFAVPPQAEKATLSEQTRQWHRQDPQNLFKYRGQIPA